MTLALHTFLSLPLTPSLSLDWLLKTATDGKARHNRPINVTCNNSQAPIAGVGPATILLRITVILGEFQRGSRGLLLCVVLR